jgi:hypothetical protein
MENFKNSLPALSPGLASGNGAGASEIKRSRTSRATGPRTTHGKERSKRNALKHGIFSRVALLKDESRAELDVLLAGLRDNLQPEGTLEEMLVEKLALSAWRLRRLITAETAEIQMAIDFSGLDAEQRQVERANEISEYRFHFEGGLIREIANPEVLERCLELLKELHDEIGDNGFDYDSDSQSLTKLYGEVSSERWQRTLFDSYQAWSEIAECSEDERQQHGYATADECKKNVLGDVDAEIKRLEQYKKARASMESERTKLEALRQHFPPTPQFDHLLRYETSLERGFDRTLSQLERLQRTRRGQPVSPKLEIHHSFVVKAPGARPNCKTNCGNSNKLN